MRSSIGRGSAKGFGAGLAAARWAMMKRRATGRKLRRRIFDGYDFFLLYVLMWDAERVGGEN